MGCCTLLNDSTDSTRMSVLSKVLTYGCCTLLNQKKTHISVQSSMQIKIDFEYFQQIFMHNRLFYTHGYYVKKVFHINGILEDNLNKGKFVSICPTCM